MKRTSVVDLHAEDSSVIANLTGQVHAQRLTTLPGPLLCPCGTSCFGSLHSPKRHIRRLFHRRLTAAGRRICPATFRLVWRQRSPAHRRRATRLPHASQRSASAARHGFNGAAVPGAAGFRAESEGGGHGEGARVLLREVAGHRSAVPAASHCGSEGKGSRSAKESESRRPRSDLRITSMRMLFKLMQEQPRLHLAARRALSVQQA